jgi:signal transduction histidine kinase
MIELATDITARKQVEEDLRVSLVDAERTGQAKTDFLATMSHEPRTPLNAIIRFS